MDFVMTLVESICWLFIVVVVVLAYRKVYPRGFRAGTVDAQEADDEFGRQKLCAECGYDLRATPDRCPECGTRPNERAEYFRRLRTEWPADKIEPRKPQPGEHVILVRTTWIPIEAKLLADQLNARGVSAAVQQERQSINPYRSTTFTAHRVVAYSGDEEFIQAFLASLHAPPTAVDVPTPPTNA